LLRNIKGFGTNFRAYGKFRIAFYFGIMLEY